MPEPKLVKTNIDTTINDIINDYRSNYKNLDFVVESNDNSTELEIDKSQISRVFQNLIINSIHSINEKGGSGSILIKLFTANNNFNVLILDDGIGLKHEKDEIIKPYFTTKKRKGGSGLGLAIVEKILFDHNADFSIENRSDGIEGAQVEIRFDLKKNE